MKAVITSLGLALLVGCSTTDIRKECARALAWGMNGKEFEAFAIAQKLTTKRTDCRDADITSAWKWDEKLGEYVKDPEHCRNKPDPRPNYVTQVRRYCELYLNR